MPAHDPKTRLDQRFSSPEAVARPWAEADANLGRAELFWLSTVRPDGRPHVTPLIAVWLDDALWFCTGPDERKAKNLAHNPACVVITGCNRRHEGLDVVVEGTAVNVRDEERLRRVAAAYLAKYGPEWTFTVVDGAFHHEGGTALVFEVAPATAFGFGKGEPFSQTRYRF
jgi:nitroimidazol reductase NimA-like FMN-containing flavoprotein (pyridoxamine 5'-phosphate oxidase superfamily)